MRAAFVLGLRSARHRPWHRIGLVVAVAAGVALATAVSITTDSAEAASTRYLSMFAAPSDVRVVGPTIAGGVTPEMIEEISSTRGVSRVVPMISEISTVTSPDQSDLSVLVLGIDCRWPGVDALGCSSNLLDSIGKRPLAVGPGLRSLVGAGRLRTDEALLPLKDTATLDELDQFNHGRVVLLGLDTASELFSRSKAVDTAFVVPDTGINSSVLREDIRAAIGDAGTVLSATARSPEVDQVLDAFVPLLNLLGIVTLVMASLVVLGLVRLDFEEHRTHLAVLGAVGATPGTLAGVVFVDAVLACAIGGALGSLGGVVVAGPMVAGISTIAEPAVGLTVTPELSAATVVEGVLIGVAVAVVAAFTAVRRASRMDIVAELQRRDRREQVRSPWTRWTAAPIVLGVLAIGGLLLTRIHGGISRWQAVIAFPLLAVLVGAMVLGFATLSNLVVRAVRPVARSVGGRTWLAVEGLARDSRRTGTTALAVAAMVTLTMVIGGTIESIRAGMERGLAGADFVATDGRLTSEQLAAIEQIPGLVGYTRVTSAVLRSDAVLVLLNVVTGELDTFPALDGRVADSGLGPGEAAIGAGLARRLGVRAGETISVAGPRAVIDVPVAAVWDQGAFGGQNITIGPELGATLFDSLAPGQIRLFPSRGVDVDELRTRIEHRLGDDGPPLLSRDEMLRRGIRNAATGLGPFRVLQLSLLATAAVSLATTMLRLVTMRRREFATLVAIGDSPGDIRRLVMLEGLLVGSIAAFLGFVAGCVLTVATTWVTPFTVGYRNPVRIDLLSGALAIAGAVVLVAAGSIPAAVSAARRDVVGTLADE